MRILNIHNINRETSLFCRKEDGTQEIIKDNSFFPFYYEYDAQGKCKGYDGTPLKKVIVSNPSDVRKNRSLGSFGSDISFKKLYLTHKIKEIEKAPIRFMFIDIEIQTKELPDIRQAKAPITCISVYDSFNKTVETFWIKNYDSEETLINEFIHYVKQCSPDLILGWNVSFDYNYLHNRIKNFAKRISPVNQDRFAPEEYKYPAGISILDYMSLFKKVFMREASYALNNISQKYLNDGDWGETDFSQVTDDIKEKNINDVKRLVKLEEKFNLLAYFDEIRRLTKVQWEDLYHNCIDDKSDILTKKGWKNYINLSETDTVLSLNIYTGNYEWVEVKEKFVYDYSGELINVNSRRVNFAVTPNHKFPMIKTHHRGAYAGEKSLSFEYANILPNQRRSFILGSNGYDKGKVDYFSDDEVKLIAWIITEGSFRTSVRAFGGGIVIYQTKANPEYREEIEHLLNKLKLKYTKFDLGFEIPSAKATKYRCLLNEKKEIPELFFELPLYQLRLFIDELTKGDGHYYNSTGYISTANLKLAEQYQIICILAGYNAYITSQKRTEIRGVSLKEESIVYKVIYIKKDFYSASVKKEKVSRKNYSGKVWCISTQFHNFVMRRENKVMISGNSAIIESLLFEEAKKMNIVLPNKQENVENTSFQGATRESSKTGALFNIGKYDLESAYPSMIINFCLDFQNIVTAKDTMTPSDLKDVVDIDGILFKQNPNTLVPNMVREILTLKNNLKKELAEHPSEELKLKYNAIKAVANSAFGAFGNQYFRLYDNRITSSITYLVRDLLMYTKDELEKKSIETVYWDTDSIFADTTVNILPMLNETIQKWGKEKYNKDSIALKYDYEGYFEKLFLLAKCRYIGYLNKKGKGKIEQEVKGVEVKRVSSAKFEGQFQEKLIDMILDKKSREEVEEFIIEQKKALKKAPLEEIAFPIKLSSIVYKGNPIQKRCLDNSRIVFKDMKIGVGEVFYYIFVKGYGYDKSNKEINVLAFKKGQNIIPRDKVDFEEMIRRNISAKVETIFEAMKWMQSSDERQGRLF